MIAAPLACRTSANADEGSVEIRTLRRSMIWIMV